MGGALDARTVSFGPNQQTKPNSGKRNYVVVLNVGQKCKKTNINNYLDQGGDDHPKKILHTGWYSIPTRQCHPPTKTVLVQDNAIPMSPVEARKNTRGSIL